MSGAVITAELPTVNVRHTSLIDYSIERDGRVWPFRSPIDITGRAMRVIPTFNGGVIELFDDRPSTGMVSGTSTSEEPALSIFRV